MFSEPVGPKISWKSVKEYEISGKCALWMAQRLAGFQSTWGISLITQLQTERRNYSVKSPLVALAWTDNLQTFPLWLPIADLFWQYFGLTSTLLWLPLHIDSLSSPQPWKKKNTPCRINWFCLGGSFAHLSTLYGRPHYAYFPGSVALAGGREGIGRR